MAPRILFRLLLVILALSLLPFCCNTQRLAWNITVMDPSYNMFIPSVCLSVTNNVAVVTTFTQDKGMLKGFDLSTGKELWTSRNIHYLNGCLIVDPKNGYIGAFDSNHSYYLVPSNGRILWSAPIHYTCAHIFAGDVLISSDQCGSTEHNWLGFNTTNGKELYKFQEYDLNSNWFIGASKKVAVLQYYEGYSFAGLNPLTGKRMNISEVETGTGNLFIPETSNVVTCIPDIASPYAKLSMTNLFTGHVFFTFNTSTASAGSCPYKIVDYTPYNPVVDDTLSVLVFTLVHPSSLVAVDANKGTHLWTRKWTQESKTGGNEMVSLLTSLFPTHRNKNREDVISSTPTADEYWWFPHICGGQVAVFQGVSWYVNGAEQLVVFYVLSFDLKTGKDKLVYKFPGPIILKAHPSYGTVKQNNNDYIVGRQQGAYTCSVTVTGHSVDTKENMKDMLFSLQF